MLLKQTLNAILLAVLLYLASPSPVYAYLDPGSGSYIFQLLIAALVGMGFVLRTYWDRIRAFFTRSSTSTEETVVEEETNVE